MTLKLNYAAGSDRGLVRDNNEDSAYAGPHLLLLADGMGGHAAGEVASQLMVEHMEHLDRDPGDNDMLALLGAAADDGNASIADSIREHPEQDGMGTTLTSLLFNGKEFGLIHAGDSRGYRLRDKHLEQITVDDTFVQSLVQQGKLNQDDVSSHPQKSLILKAYTGRPVDPYLAVLDAKPGDRLLLCSDGLSDPVTSSTIEAAMNQGTPEEAVQVLIELALRSGGPDNVTIVIADVVEGDSDTPVPTKPVLAGALALEQNETHPDTAAGRAAALNRKPQVIPPNQNAEGHSRLADSEVGDDDEEVHPAGSNEHESGRKKNGRGRWGVIISLLVVLIVLLGGGIAANRIIDNRFFVSVNADNQFVIEHGVDFSVFGNRLNEPIQLTCIDGNNELKFVDIGAVPKDCETFSSEDLPASAQGAAENLPSGSYDEVTQQLNRLANEALPVCVDAPRGAANDETRQVECREVN
ncbi:PP2C family protein-serine/threonine phosphatase [Corynebacterium lubricantis]|uniref:PP2C family protein-serine/threonine phosphatase n=1 Tax=Corynebacterium lubricantis TaxID=541095 RepID=UPI00037B3AE1|nr:protein phosphatase 2C domain-containing protein [Corynebacterium lubricantis]